MCQCKYVYYFISQQACFVGVISLQKHKAYAYNISLLLSLAMHMDMAGVQLSALIYVAKKLFYGLFGSCLLLLWSTFHCQLFCVVCCSDEHILFQASQLVLLFNTINWTMTRIKNAPNFLRPPLNRTGTRSRILSSTEWPYDNWVIH